MIMAWLRRLFSRNGVVPKERDEVHKRNMDSIEKMSQSADNLKAACETRTVKRIKEALP